VVPVERKVKEVGQTTERKVVLTERPSEPTDKEKRSTERKAEAKEGGQATERKVVPTDKPQSRG